MRDTLSLDERSLAARTVGVGVHPLPGAARPPTCVPQGGLPQAHDGVAPCVCGDTPQISAGTVPSGYVQPKGGMARFQAGVRPPPVRIWHLADLPAVSAMLAVVGENLPAHRLLGPVQAGLSGILPLGPDMLTTFVLNYTHQLNHPNPLTRASAKWGLMCALWRFSPDMPCVRRGLVDCECHPTDHDRFLRCTWLMDIRVWAVLEGHHVEVPKHPLGVAGTVSDADDAHAAVAAGYRDWACTRRAGWPSWFRGPEILPPWPRHVQWAQEQIPEGITLRDIPDEAVFVQDASWYPIHTAGGGLVVADPETGWRQAYSIPIPVHVDGSYQAELYVAWEVLRARGAHRVVWGTRGQQWSFHDSKGYIDAVQSRNPGSSPLSNYVLRTCRGLLARGFNVPQHLYSHRVGTFLDSLLDDANGVAKRQAAKAQPAVGWAHGLQAPRVCFTHNTIRVHNLDRLVQAAARRLWSLHTEAPEQAVRKSLSVYHAVTERGLIHWGAHLHTMARREGLGHAGDTRPCPACQREVGTRHWVATCPWRHVLRLAVHTQLHMRLDTLCARWKRRVVSTWGVIVLYGPDAFALSVGSPDDDDPHPGPVVRTIYLDPFGDWEVEDLGYMYDRGLVVGAAQHLLALVVNFWDALYGKREMPIIPAAREVYYRDAHGQTWDLATRVPVSCNPAAYEWGARPAMAGFWPRASLLWPVCERGQLTAVMPPGQQLPPD